MSFLYWVRSAACIGTTWPSSPAGSAKTFHLAGGNSPKSLYSLDIIFSTIFLGKEGNSASVVTSVFTLKDLHFVFDSLG